MDLKKDFNAVSHHLTNFEIQTYFGDEPRFNGFSSRDNLPNKIKDEACVINILDYSDIGTYWICFVCIE